MYVQVVSLLKVLPNRYTGDVLEELRLGKQALVCFLDSLERVVSC